MRNNERKQPKAPELHSEHTVPVATLLEVKSECKRLRRELKECQKECDAFKREGERLQLIVHQLVDSYFLLSTEKQKLAAICGFANPLVFLPRLLNTSE
ncbi:MAG TPA: hypothetical protein VKN76_03665, partial [Kiloniellaceae bacterium]|nr:hypothetical protein [Kiloniellaceae bacterium]